MRKEQLLKILLAPHTTEKASTSSGESGCAQYVFRVANSANKHDIKLAVEQLFQVNVKAVNVLRKKAASASKYTRSIGRQLSWKKAYVVLAAGQTINIA
ncbi:MAG: 50S ribosomal protein L23 [Gammaproteobacteria bacterium RIFCSPHIGHO2_02_FULL_39_13]|nr:MAG: 50S ribosomal protein L23 [Gammaproteobacteria bacterium RIFCSPHIGHO2_02_FULL_39_13]OGT48619.1 MAG: 50S ribosomal protein L23 [Gammaproteobacteria bacterium RIFCSPHIGHO2_12_FULL_39_24]